MCTVSRADLRLVGLDNRIDRRRIDQPLFRQHRLQRFNARLHIGVAVVVMMIVVVIMVIVQGNVLPE